MSPLADLVGLQVEYEMQPFVKRSVRPLPPVVQVHFRELQADRFGVWLVLSSGLADRGDRHVVERDDQIFLLSLAGLAVGDRRVLDVLSGGARLKEGGSGVVDVVDD